MTGNHTPEQVRAAIKITLAVGDAIRELGEVPAGTLYAQMMNAGISLDDFNAIVATLERAGVVTRDAQHLIRWIGPQKAIA